MMKMNKLHRRKLKKELGNHVLSDFNRDKIMNELNK